MERPLAVEGRTIEVRVNQELGLSFNQRAYGLTEDDSLQILLGINVKNDDREVVLPA